MSGPARKWDDLRPRILTAVVLFVVGGGALLVGNWPLLVLLVLACVLMFWELARMLSPDQKIENLLQSKHKIIFVLYGALILAGCFSILYTRQIFGPYVFWLVAVVVASDVAGYLVGRVVGGPKFWPRISPKKTWSGTIGGWVGAALVGMYFSSLLNDNLLIASVLLALAAQLGDIAESAIKRRVGVKDSSNLLPGHGGLLDRFDAMIATFALWLIISPLIVQIPDWI